MATFAYSTNLGLEKSRIVTATFWISEKFRSGHQYVAYFITAFWGRLEVIAASCYAQTGVTSATVDVDLHSKQALRGVTPGWATGYREDGFSLNSL